MQGKENVYNGGLGEGEQRKTEPESECEEVAIGLRWR